MADLAAVTAIVRAVEIIEQETGPASEAIEAGAVVGYVAASGAICEADADTGPILPKGIALNDATIANMTITMVKKGTLDVGSILDGLNYGAPVYASGTPGLLADAAVGGLAPIGEVVPGRGTTTPDKLLRVNL